MARGVVLMGVISLLFAGRVWHHQLGFGQLGDVEVAHLYSQSGGGLHYVKFKMALPASFTHPMLEAGTKVEVFRGPVRLGSGVLTEPDLGDGRVASFTVDGTFKNAERFKAPTLTNQFGQTYIDLRNAVDRANTAGMGWNGHGNIPVDIIVSQRTEGDEAASITEVLNSYCTLTGQRWGLDANDVPYITSDPTDPSWALTPGRPLMATGDPTSVSVVAMRYLVSGTTTAPTDWATVTAGTPSPDGRQEFVDLTPLGVMDSVRAQQYADNYIAVNGVRVTYSEGIDVIPGELTTLGGSPLAFWTAGLSVLGKRGLHHGVIDTTFGGTGKTITWVCGSTLYRDDSYGGSLQMFATDLSPRTQATVISYLEQATKNQEARDKGLVTAE